MVSATRGNGSFHPFAQRNSFMGGTWGDRWGEFRWFCHRRTRVVSQSSGASTTSSIRTLFGARMEASVWSYNGSADVSLKRCYGRHVPVRCSATSFSDFLQRLSRNVASLSGSRSPLTMPRMLNPVMPVMSPTAVHMVAMPFAFCCPRRVSRPRHLEPHPQRPRAAFLALT